MEDFFKKVYHPEDKTIDAWYYVSSETNTQTTLLNVQEKELSGKEWANGAVDYRFKVQEIKLPKSQIRVLSHDPNREGYYLIKIPYWLFKKNFGLEIHRISLFKKFSIKPDDSEIEKFTTTEYQKALKGAGTDMNHIKIVVENRFQSLNPKPTPSPIEKDENTNHSIWNVKYSKD
jgi:hypothetical protein